MKKKKALILAGGLGARLRPLTFAIPKPLIPVRGKPIIDYIITRLVKFNFSDLYVSLNYRADLIKLYLADRGRKGCRIGFFEETIPLGTAGPLSFFKKHKLADRESVLAMNGDILTDLDFGRLSETHEKSGADLTIAMINFSHTLAYGILDLDKNNKVTGVREKPTVSYKASAGIYLIRKSALEAVPDMHFTMPELIHSCLRGGLVVRGYLVREHWLAIEQIKQLEEASEQKKGDWISKL